MITQDYLKVVHIKCMGFMRITCMGLNITLRNVA